jgi:hypothetical protein
MRYIVALVALATPLPALAQTSATVTVGQTLRGPADSKLGKIDRVFADGSVRVILDGKLVVVPGSTIKVTDGKPVTTLSRREIARN